MISFLRRSAVVMNEKVFNGKEPLKCLDLLNKLKLNYGI